LATAAATQSCPDGPPLELGLVLGLTLALPGAVGAVAAGFSAGDWQPAVATATVTAVMRVTNILIGIARHASAAGHSAPGPCG
jgi:hypothetical protein